MAPLEPDPGGDSKPAAGGGTPPSASRVLRRSLLGWGLGHVMLGDRRGWLLFALQPIAIIAVALLAIDLIDGTRWLVVFPPLAALIVVWIGQAVAAHNRAVREGGEPGGEIAIALLLPLAVTVLTVFWLLGGRHGSPSATLQAYIEAWISDRPEVAATLFTTPRTTDSLSTDWAAQRAALTGRIATARATYGESSGLDPDKPFNSLRFSQATAEGEGRVGMVVEIVRSRRVETTVLGIVPTAGQETVAIERDMTIWLELQRQPPPAWMPFGGFDSYSWRISSIEAGAP